MPGSASSSKGSGGRNSNYGIVATQHYESGPPASKMQLSTLDDGEVYETVKEEEWLTRKKVTTTTTKNIETRTQRQVVLEDGEVVEDSGPIVTRDCKEDTVTNEVVADEHLTPEGQDGGHDEPPGEGWEPVGGAVVVSEKTEHITNSHQVAENKEETEEVTHLGDVTNKEVEDHVDGRGDLKALTEAREGRGWEVAKPERRVVHESARKWGTVNTEDVRETSRVQDGHVVTETERTTQHEEYDNESLPDSGSSLSDGSVHEEARETQHNIVHTKDEDIVEYYAVPQGGTLAQGVKLGEGMHVVSEDFHEDREGEELDSLSERLRRARRLGAIKPKPRATPERTDALTRRPLDYHEEEETRKCETNRWLENHFGSESGHSGSSHHDQEEESAIHTAGGNIITITMSPRPATPEDQPDAAPSGIRRWSNAPLATSSSDDVKAPPPPPPPKPAATWAPSAPVTSHQPVPVPPADEITDSMIAAARAKLRTTGRILDDSEQSTPPISPPATNGTRFTSLQDRGQGYSKSSRGSFASPPTSPTGVNNNYQPDDPVFGSKFRSGSPCGYVPSRLLSTPLKNSRPTSNSPPDSPPPPLPSTPPPQNSNVGRSQSFNVQTKSWMNNIVRTPSARPLESRMKEYRSEEQLDAVGHRSARLWPPPRRDPSPEPPREPTPPPPPRQRNNYSSPTNHTHYNTAPTRSSRSRKSESFSQSVARDSATQTGPSPVPPPRTKRKTKPKTYYFGEDSSSTTSSSNRVSKTPVVSTSTTTKSYSRVMQDNKTSPKIERRFKTTKTITPVVVATPSSYSNANHNASLKNKKFHYRSMDELSCGNDNTPRASWTNTVDPRRQPRNYNVAKEPEIRTLPKKLMNGTASPSKTYIYGNESSSGRSRMGSGSSSSNIRRSHGGSMINVSLAGMSSPKSNVYPEPEVLSTPLRGVKPVIRSQSLNVKPASLSTIGTTPTVGTGVPSKLLSQQRTSTVYRSSPYLNLRSANLVATVARSNSTRRTEEDYNGDKKGESPPPPERFRSSYASRNGSSRNNSISNRGTNNDISMTNGDDDLDDEKRNRFMKGLLTTAPELFHFIHGEEENKESNNNREKNSNSPPESPPQLIRPPESPINSPISPPSSNAPRIFTFGRGENGSLKRTPSMSQENNDNRFSSLGRHRESITSSYLENNNNNNHRDSTASLTNTTNQRNSLSSQHLRNASMTNINGTNSLHRPKFNLKTSGSSLLYSPSFRSQTDSTPPSRYQRRGSDSNDSPSHRWRDQDDDNHIRGKTGRNVTQTLARDGAVLIPIKDWNSR